MSRIDIDYWVIGFLWGSARISGDHLLVQNMDKELLQKAKKNARIENEIFTAVTEQGNISYRFKIHSKNNYVQYILNNGYEGRVDNEKRGVPTSLNKNNEYDFLKGYFSTHYTYDIVTRNKKLVPRIRFYATYNILDLLNNHLYEELGTTIKKISNHGNNNVCKILHYQSKKEIDKIINYLELKV